jgi:hypothetical protein
MYRANVLGRAILAVRTDPSRFRLRRPRRLLVSQRLLMLILLLLRLVLLQELMLPMLLRLLLVRSARRVHNTKQALLTSLPTPATTAAPVNVDPTTNHSFYMR